VRAADARRYAAQARIVKIVSKVKEEKMKLILLATAATLVVTGSVLGQSAKQNNALEQKITESSILHKPMRFCSVRCRFVSVTHNLIEVISCREANQAYSWESDSARKSC
jgi:hypothetical protein